MKVLELTAVALMFIGMGAPAHAAPETTRAAMAEIVTALKTALPLSVDERTFAAEANRPALAAALDALARASRDLPDHGSPTDAGFAFLSRSLSRDADAIVRRFQAEEWEPARFLLHEVTENCVACHSRLPDPLARPLGKRLVDDPTLRELPLDQRVRLEVATRQFDRALESYAEMFESQAFSAADLDLMGHVDGFLEVCLRVRLGACDPEPVLAGLAKRTDTPAVLQANIAKWRTSWKEQTTRKPEHAEIAEVRRLVKDASDPERYSDARAALVPYFTASGLAHRYLRDGEPGFDELAETYYWLGFIETRVGRAFWPSEGEYYLEAAIRVAPGSEHAVAAYDLLEQVSVIGYTGSDGGELPDDVRERLDGLNQRIEDAQRRERTDLPGPM